MSSKIVGAATDAVLALQSFTDALARLPGVAKIDFSDTIFSLAELSERLKATAQSAGKEDGGAAKTIEELNTELNRVLEGIGNTSDKLSEGQQALKDYAKAAEDVQASTESAALRGVKALEDSLVNIVTGAESAKEAFRSMAQSILADIARIVIQQQISGPIAEALGSFFASGSTGTVPPKPTAIGGPVQRGVPRIVGEMGKELFVPSSSGSIVSNKALAAAGVGGGGGITVNQTINVTTGVQQTVRSEIVNLMPQIANATKAAVADSRLRGGSFSKAFGG